MKKLTKHQSRLFELIINGVLVTSVLFLSNLNVGYMIVGDANYVPWLFAGAALCMAAIYVVMFIFREKSIYKAIRLFGQAAFYLVCIVFAFLGKVDPIFFKFYGVVFALSIIYSSAWQIVLAEKKGRAIVSGVLKTLFALLLIGIMLVLNEEEPSYYIVLALLPVCTAIISFTYAIFLVFSGLRRKTLIKIIRQTYAIEIIYGMVVLLFTVALLLTMVESSMTNIGDSLWYCFSIVTTIGFGDFHADTVVGRILSVILGLYGIVVVALITSIIVNFYNETKADREKRIEEEIKKIEEENNGGENNEQ